ncbi:hypothetical protein OSB04_012123 [Centaurea solstitialis]|uniref:Integrase catalytic domain-containing protein n=1 Tax=Centaurea solstitialis TaxID=347529 RepID=A0AA38WPR5_9ASTR|nr:hypothetical protein OSB04_012123 [Centaurea solstitialis]
MNTIRKNEEKPSRSFYEEKGIERQYSAPRTPQQNGVAERRNRTLIEAARTMLADSKLPITFWVEAVNTACYVKNRSKALRVFNISTRIIEESDNVRCNENSPNLPSSGPNWLFDIDSLTNSLNMSSAVMTGSSTEKTQETNTQFVVFPMPTVDPIDLCTSDNKEPNQEKEAQSTERNVDDQRHEKQIEEVSRSNNIVLSPTSEVEPVEPPGSSSSTIELDLNDSNLGVNLPEEPLHLTRTQKNHPPSLVIGDIQSPMITRKQSKAINDPHFGMISIAKIEAIRLFLDFASYKGFKVYKMDIKSAFLYGTVDEEVYVGQPPGFEDPKYLDKVYKLRKALYGLHQAPRAWYDTLSSYLLENQFERGVIYKTLFIKRTKTDVLLVQIYVDDIIFGSTKEEMCKAFEELMYKKFKMSSMGELTFFLDLQVKQKTNGIRLGQKNPLYKQSKGYSNILRVNLGWDFGIQMSLLLILWPILIVIMGGANLDRKSTSGGCQFLGARLVSWQCKKQTTVSQSTTEAEYIAAAHCCSQVLWIQNQMLDYGLSFLQTPIYIDNNNAISIFNNPVKHSKTKHIEIKYHFIRDCNEKKLIQVLKVHTDDQFADLFTKAFDEGRFTFLVTSVGMINSE